MAPRLRILVATLGAVLALPALAGDCPQGVKDAAMKAHPAAQIVACKQEQEDGSVQYSVKLVGKGGEKLELDVSSDGQVLLTEEYVALDAVPPAILKSLKTKHPNAKLQKAEKLTDADGEVTYEIVFGSGDERESATFDMNGNLVEEEEEEEEGQE